MWWWEVLAWVLQVWYPLIRLHWVSAGGLGLGLRLASALCFGASAYHDTKPFICPSGSLAFKTWSFQGSTQQYHLPFRHGQSVLCDLFCPRLLSFVVLISCTVTCGLWRFADPKVLLRREGKGTLRNSNHFLEERLYKDSYIEE